MPEPIIPANDDTKPPLLPPNGQLATPALTPISENGDRQLHRFPASKERPHGYAMNDGTALREAGSNLHSELALPRSDLPDVATRRRSSTKTGKLSPLQLHDLVSSPESIPIRPLDADGEGGPTHVTPASSQHFHTVFDRSPTSETGNSTGMDSGREFILDAPPGVKEGNSSKTHDRPQKSARSASTPVFERARSSSRQPRPKPLLAPLKLDGTESGAEGGGTIRSAFDGRQASPMPAAIPLPPLSLPTYLQLELSSERPSALYIHRPAVNDFPYESAQAKFERLQNFLLLAPNLEQVLWFGAIACLDSWLYTFTVLPLRFLKAAAMLLQWLTQNAAKEVHDLGLFVYRGLGRVWQRRSSGNRPVPSRRPSELSDAKDSHRTSVIDGSSGEGIKMKLPPSRPPVEKTSHRKYSHLRHRRTKSTPSSLLPNHKADILQGLLIAISGIILMRLDASRVYHNIRGQGAIKLYVIYNVLEVFDRLFSAVGQDILECLFSKETLERDEYGRSKILRPFWMFLLALAYNLIHTTALFYQVVTLNVAVNSYSNALLTLLMSNQFVEIKGTVFKKFEKENLFQLTCADVVERFQLWLMLLIIALRNIVEVGGLSISLNTVLSATSTAGHLANSTNLPTTGSTLIPKAFTLFPKWTGEVLGPFLIVLGSEALVDWCKHAYITKFNQVKPNIYGRFLDVLAKDYYAHAFADQNLTKRLGLPVIPLSCLFIRACVQTYHMFIATYMPPPLVPVTTGISLDNETTASSPTTTAALQHVDRIFRRALGSSSFGAAGTVDGNALSWWSVDDIIAFATMIIFFLALYLVLLALKLVLGIALLSFARRRYKGMKERERQSVDTNGRRVGGWGTVEVGEDKRRWIYDDDPDGLRALREKEERNRSKIEKDGDGLKLDAVQRYSMTSKRIW